jgi:hypothetical protein
MPLVLEPVPHLDDEHEKDQEDGKPDRDHDEDPAPFRGQDGCCGV